MNILITSSAGKKAGDKFRYHLITLLIILMIPAGFNLNGQIPEKSKVDKSNLSLKPNSREVAVSMRNNNFQKIHKIRKPLNQKPKGPNYNKKIRKKNVDAAKKQEILQRRKQMMQQRRATRR